jgi:hypothetical protein
VKAYERYNETVAGRQLSLKLSEPAVELPAPNGATTPAPDLPTA